MEPWKLQILVKQKSRDHLQVIRITSNEFLNVNITFGMAYNLQMFKVKFLDQFVLLQ